MLVIPLPQKRFMGGALTSAILCMHKILVLRTGLIPDASSQGIKYIQPEQKLSFFTSN